MNDVTVLDIARRERLVRVIVAEAAPELARRAAGRGPVFQLAGWARPALLAAVVVAVVAGTLLATWGDEAKTIPPAGVAEALGLPAPVAAWLEAGRTPEVEEVLVALEAGSR